MKRAHNLYLMLSSCYQEMELGLDINEIEFKTLVVTLEKFGTRYSHSNSTYSKKSYLF